MILLPTAHTTATVRHRGRECQCLATASLGAAIAVGFAMILRGRGGDPICHAAGAGVLTPGRAEEKAKLAQEIDAGKVTPAGLEPTSSDTNSKP